MAKTQWIILLATSFISTGSLILVAVSFATNYWVVAEATQAIAVRNSKINYGLFSGSLTRNLLASETNYHLAIVCLYDQNACIYSCQNTPEHREDELHRIINRLPLLECPIQRTILSNRMNLAEINNDNLLRNNSQISITKDSWTEVNYIDPGLWLTTVIGLSVIATFAFIAAFFAVVNTIFNPVEPILSILGLYIWNGIATGAGLLTLTVWGILYAVILTENVAITDTLRREATFHSDGLAALGFSYWILCCPTIFHIINIGLLLWRKRIIEMEPPPPTVNVDKNDFTIMLY